ncbi:MAG TPA: hypothetical protein VGU20_04765 [Stellaceae bacterium]|nr:hypothetical protein [Stellaceae bacterium]
MTEDKIAASLDVAERRVARELEPELRDHLRFTTTVFNLIGTLTSHAPKEAKEPTGSLPLSLQSAIKLLLRLAKRPALH